MIAYSVKLKFQTQEHEDYWRHVLDTATCIYNDIAKMVYDANCPLIGRLMHHLTYFPMREKYPSVSAHVIAKIVKDVRANIIAAKKICKNPACPIRKNPSLTLDKKLYSYISPKHIKLASAATHKRQFVDFVTYPKFNELAEKYEMKAPLLYIRNGEIYLRIVFDVLATPVNNEDCLGVDLGIRRIFTTSDGVAYKGTYLNGLKRKIRFKKRQLSSKGTKSAKRKLKKLRRKERNISLLHTHLMANKILNTDKSIIVLEELKGIKERTKKTKKGFNRNKHNNKISQIPIYNLKIILKYKAPLLGKKVETVSPSYTSQIDCISGKRDGERRGCRYYSKSGLIYDADWNAAINICNRYSKLPLSSITPLDGKLTFLGQAAANQPNVSIANIRNKLSIDNS